MELESIVERYILRHHLLDKGKLYLVALSGGADSVTLFLVLLRLGFHIEAVHCNFHLRGDESDRDEQFVKDICESNHVVLHISHFDTRSYSESHHVSIEMAARELRYSYFEKLRHDISAEGICVAHHQDDSVETFLMNIIRGTGIHGLTGIRPVNGYIIRPLLCVSRSEIEQYLGSVHQKYVTDSTNLIDDVVRNKIRIDVMPILKSINPSVADNMVKTMEHVSDLLPLIDHTLEMSVRDVVTERTHYIEISVSRLLKTEAPESILYHIIRKYGFTSAQTEQIFMRLESGSGKVYQSEKYDLITDRDTLLVTEHLVCPSSLKIPEDGCYEYQEGVKYRFKYLSRSEIQNLKCAKNEVLFDADKVKFPLTLRGIHTGDKFIPFGMNGAKLISDFMTDMKMNKIEKNSQLILSDADDNILWVVGRRADNRCRIDESTQMILSVTEELDSSSTLC
jgi:tRNA(Ile)-lysidine synthase